MRGRPFRYLRTVLIAIAVIVALISIAIIGVRVWLMNRYVHAVSSSASQDTCVTVPGVPHPEDIEVDWARQRAFTGALFDCGELKQGIYRIDLTHGRTLKNVTPPEMAHKVRALGLSLYTAPDGRQKLFAVNRAPVSDLSLPTEHSVQIFDVAEDGTLTLDTEVKGAEIYNPDALVAVGPKQFYLTNDHVGLDSDLDTWFDQMYFLLGLDTSSNLIFFDGEKFKTVVDGLRLADGIDQSLDGNKIYVAEGFGRSLTTFARDPRTNDLKFISKTMLPGAPDNIRVTPEGKLLVAVFPDMVQMLKYLTSGRGAKRPSAAVLELTPRGNTFDIRHVWSDDGERITAVTVGAPYAKHADRYSLLLGTISPEDNLVLACVPGTAGSNAQ
jgi:arylesterase/paraoxonase